MNGVLYLLGFVVAAAGVIGGLALGDQTHQWIIPSAIVFSGVVSGVMIAAVGNIIELLGDIRDNLRAKQASEAQVAATAPADGAQSA